MPLLQTAGATLELLEEETAELPVREEDDPLEHGPACACPLQKYSYVAEEELDECCEEKTAELLELDEGEDTVGTVQEYREPTPPSETKAAEFVPVLIGLLAQLKAGENVTFLQSAFCKRPRMRFARRILLDS